MFAKTLFAKSKTTVCGLTAAAILAGSLASTSATAAPMNVGPALAKAEISADTSGDVTKVGWRRRHRHHHGGAAAAGLVFGLAAGAIAAGAYAQRDCGWVIVRKKRYNRWGERVIVRKKVWVCD
ncbi:hypothetical protein [Rhodobium gokarnense]|uniref:Uncharacterized protein n=1 Tax=Rhodobium gokarnense TaxID=364296 RepID=A0ABT3H9P3_9HYPH|nr:hypothetical protein [Rhodobium gokarnense]MCW2307121.1 hypothetical protein [Rhodobium gokarnense]